MIATCPTCAARIRLDRPRLGGKRITLRCTRCRNIFKVEIPVASDSTRIRVAVAHGDPALCATIRDLVTAEGMECRICHDADGILQQMETTPPHVVVIDVAITGLYVFEVIERIRRLSGPMGSRVILLSSVYKRAAYKRTPTSLYGADDYIEKHHLPDDLVPKIFALTANALPTTYQAVGEEVMAGKPAVAVEEERAARVFCDEVNARILAAEEEETSVGEAVEKARRLARIIVADIALYSQEKVEEGIRSDTFFTLFTKEIEEGRRLFDERVAPEVRHRSDFLQEAFVAFIHRRRGELGLQSR